MTTEKNSLSSACPSPNNPASVSLSTSGLCVATACSQCCEKKVSSALVRRGCCCCCCSELSDAAMAQRARMMGSVGAGKSGGTGVVIGMEKCRAQRRRSRLIHLSLSVGG
jgi:hypothetical protein